MTDKDQTLKYEECGECMGDIKKGEKVVATCRGKRIFQNKKLEIEFYHEGCWEKKFGKANVLMTVSAWKQKFREDYHE